MTVTFLAIGGFALLLLVLSLVGGHLHLGDVHIGHAPGVGSFEFTLPAVAGFLGAFGFGGAIVAALVGTGGVVAALLAVVLGLVVGLPAAWATGRLTTAAAHMATDATLTSSDLLGATGIVVTPVPAGGYGEVRLAIAGQQIKLNARADNPLPLGTPVFVIEVPSPTSVLVEPTPGMKERP